jgi:hypothetical protein
VKTQFIAFLVLTLLASCTMDKKQSVEINVDASQIIHTMKGGIGASWHALHHDIPLENEKYKYPVREIAPREAPGAESTG